MVSWLDLLSVLGIVASCICGILSLLIVFAAGMASAPNKADRRAANLGCGLGIFGAVMLIACAIELIR